MGKNHQLNMYLGIVAQGSFYKQIIMYWRTELGKIDVFWSEYESSYIKSFLKILIVTIFKLFSFLCKKRFDVEYQPICSDH